MLILFVMSWSCVLCGAAMGACTGWPYGLLPAVAGFFVGLCVGFAIGYAGNLILGLPVLLILATDYVYFIEYDKLSEVPSRVRRACYQVLYGASCLFLAACASGIVCGATYATHRSVTWLALRWLAWK